MEMLDDISFILKRTCFIQVFNIITDLCLMYNTDFLLCPVILLAIFSLTTSEDLSFYSLFKDLFFLQLVLQIVLVSN